jgi:hypothetical protein
MAIVANAIQAATKAVPRFVSAEEHRAVDYVLASTLVVGGVALWHKNRKASLASLLCGGALIGLNLATKYPRNSGAPLTIAHHRQAEKGLAVLLASLPGVLRLEKEVGRYFSAHSLAFAVLDNLTAFPSSDFSRTSR